jgi:hypothetical protein
MPTGITHDTNPRSVLMAFSATTGSPSSWVLGLLNGECGRLDCLKSFGMDMPPAGLPLAYINKDGRPELHSESEGMVTQDLLRYTAYVVLFHNGNPVEATCHCCGQRTKGYVCKPGSTFVWCFRCWR